uniref:Charged multivesicular body protein 6 n=1 Tax=Steinernema glaseri TaxID=37863 RepID=A0A1I8AH57_9BILA
MFSIEDVEAIMEDTREAAEYQEEISNMIAGGLSQSDLADVEEEFERLVEAEAGEVVLPEVPTEEPVVPEAEGERPVREKPKREKVLVATE